MPYWRGIGHPINSSGRCGMPLPRVSNGNEMLSRRVSSQPPVGHHMVWYRCRAAWARTNPETRAQRAARGRQHGSTG
jgi:hypothetical protein